MAYEYDQLGNVIGEYESDEERRRRLDAEAAQQPVKQTTTYNPDGTQEMTIRGTPQALSAANPNTPTLTTSRVRRQRLQRTRTTLDQFSWRNVPQSSYAEHSSTTWIWR